MTTNRAVEETVMFDEVELMAQFPDVVFGDLFAIALASDKTFHLFTEDDGMWTVKMTVDVSFLRDLVTVGKRALAIKNGR